MALRSLCQLSQDEFIAKYDYIATPVALYRALRRSSEVSDLRRSLESGALSEASIRGFIEDLLGHFRKGDPFQYDLTLAAIAVAIENWQAEFADEYLSNLSSLEASEISRSTRIANEVIKLRLLGSGTAIDTRSLTSNFVQEIVGYEEWGARFADSCSRESIGRIVCGA